MADWNITRNKPRDPTIVVEEMTAEDIAKYFPAHVQAELTGSFKAIDIEQTIADAVFDKEATRG